MRFQLPLWPVLIWNLTVIAASIVYRRARGKPVLFFSVPGASFMERTASGCCTDRWWRKLGGANNCLVVAVTSERLVIRTWFPFNLLFLPEIFGLEYDVPLRSVVSATWDRMFFRRCVRVRLRDANVDGDVSLFLKQPEEFIRLVTPGV